MDELVRGFAQGQVSRRVFIRRMVAAGATIGGATTFANLIQAFPANASTLNEGVFDYYFDPPALHLDYPDDYVSWKWDPSSSDHTVSDTSGLGLFDSSKVGYPGPPSHWDWVTAFGFGFWAAGTYNYECKDTYHPAMTGKVMAPLYLVPSKTRASVAVQWGSRDLSADLTFPNLRYDVQLRKPGEPWKTWKSGVGSIGANYRTRLEGKHKFRARVRDTNTQVAIGWSPVAIFKVT